MGILDKLKNVFGIWSHDSMLYEVTTRCNLKCLHCGSPSESVNLDEELTTDETDTEILANETINENLLVFPNPITDYATIKLPDAVEIKQIDIINVYGKTVRIIEDVYSNIISFQRENLPNGISSIRIRAKDSYLKKVIIM